MGTGIAAAVVGGGLGAAYGSSQIVSGLGGAVGGLGDLFYTNKAAAEASRGAETALDLFRNFNPVERRQFQEVQGRLGMITEMGMMAGGTGTDAWRRLANASVAGGITDREGMGIFSQLRAGIGQEGAMGLLGTATTSMNRWGIERGTAASALASMASMGQGATGADERLTQVISRAFAAGLKDSAVQGALATRIAGLTTSIAGRGYSAGHAATMISEATGAFGGGMSGLSLATQSYGLQASLGGTGGPVQAMNVAQSASIFRVASKYGLSRTTQLALVTVASSNPMAIKEAKPGSQIWEMIAAEGKDPTRILSELGAGASNTANAFLGGMLRENKIGAQIIAAGAFGGTGETIGGALGMMGRGVTGDVANVNQIAFGNGQALLNLAQRGYAGVQVSPVTQFIDKMEAQGGVEKLMASLALAGNVMSNTLGSLKPEQLSDIPGIIQATTAALQEMSGACERILRLASNYGMATHQPAAPTQSNVITTSASHVVSVPSPNISGAGANAPRSGPGASSSEGG